MKALELFRNNDHVVLVAAIEFSMLKDIVRFTMRESSNWSDGSNKEENDIQYYQRPTNEKRLSGIKRHIEESLFQNKSEDNLLFPSSTIISLDLDISELESTDGLVNVNLPLERESCLIVDGQHRLRAMKELYEELNKNQKDNLEKLNLISSYKFNCTLLINFDLWEQSRIFASVNFNQKPVDRSLYFDIFGEVNRENKDKNLSNLYVAHELGKFLNTSEKSPLRGFVKNFATKKGFISQAFLTEAILALLGPRSNWNYIVYDYKNEGELYKKLPKVFVGYFEAVKKSFPESWPASTNKEDATILSKTNGIGALIKLLGWLDRMLKLGLIPKTPETDVTSLSLEEITMLFEKLFKELKKENDQHESPANRLFGKRSTYAGGGSVGLQYQLFRELAESLGVPYDRKLISGD